MPKNSTVTKRTSTASSKKNGLKKRFDLTNRKVQFFVVIAIVAVLGGGYFTVRSFAAEATLYTWSVSNGALQCRDYNQCKPLNDTSKNNMQVYQIYGAPDGRSSEVNTGSDRRYLAANTQYKVCFTAKGQQRLSIMSDYDFVPPILLGEVTVNDSNAYKNYCLPYRSTRAADTGFSVTNKDSSWRTIPMFGVFITQIYVTRDLPTPTAPAPPAK